MARNHVGKPSFRDYVLWDLKLRGDINENHKGGNAMVVLKERMILHGAPKKQTENLAAVVTQLVSVGKIKKLADGRRVKALRLTASAKMGENPYPPDSSPHLPAVIEQPSTDLVPDYKTLAEPFRHLSTEERMALATALMSTVYEDIASVKTILR